MQVEAVLFDWGDTLMRFEWSEERVAMGIRAGLEAVGAGVADVGAVARAFTERVTDHLGQWSP